MTRHASNEEEMPSSSRANRLADDDDHSTPVGATRTNGSDGINGASTGGVMESGIVNEEQHANAGLSSEHASKGNGKKQ